jgi:hypothetical protein
MLHCLGSILAATNGVDPKFGARSKVLGCAGAGKNLRCFASETCFVNSDCESGSCVNVGGGQQCSTERAQEIIAVFGAYIVATTVLTLGCCIRVMCQKRRAANADHDRAAKKAASANKLAFHRPEFALMRNQLLNDLNISLNCCHQWTAMPTNQYKESLANDSACLAVVNRFRLLSLAALELMKDEKELERCSEAERDALLDSGAECHEKMTEAAAVLARALIGGQSKDASMVREDLRISSEGLTSAMRTFLKKWPDSLLDGVEVGRDGSVDPRVLSKIERKALGLVPTFHDMPQILVKGGLSPYLATMWRFKCFYFTIEAFLLAVLITFLVQVDSPNNDTFIGFQDSPGGFGKPFLGVPPHYNFAVTRAQSVQAAFTFGFMHMALVILGFVPLPICRGIIRDLLQVWPGMKKWMPVDEFDLLHRQLGTLCMVYLYIGTVIWMFQMAGDCFANVKNSCLAFDSAVIETFDPIENVTMLRLVIWPLWFFIFPIMYFARTGVPTPFDKLKFLRRWWFEICMYSHIIVAVLTLMMALVGRKEVFFPVILSWWFYILDRVRENIFFVRRATVRQKTLYADQRQLPVGFRISMTLDGPLPIEAGMWVYVMVPQCDLTWHPFSIASSSGDECVDLHIGIHPRNYGKWEMNQYSEWIHTEGQWTYKLYRLLAGSRARAAREFTILIRGPHGAAFADCFDAKRGGAVVIGAGTGLTAAEAVLREFLHRKAVDRPAPARLWFVWSCTNVDDLFWTWDQLLGLLSAAVATGIIRPLRNQRGALIDWLGVTVYLSRGTDEAFNEFCEIQRAKFDADNRDVGEWLLTRIYKGSMDDKHTHIESLFRSAHRVLKQTKNAKSLDISVGFCGPPALGNTIQRAAMRSVPEGVHVNIDFSMDHQ